MFLAAVLGADVALLVKAQTVVPSKVVAAVPTTLAEVAVVLVTVMATPLDPEAHLKRRRSPLR